MKFLKLILPKQIGNNVFHFCPALLSKGPDLIKEEIRHFPFLLIPELIKLFFGSGFIIRDARSLWFRLWLAFFEIKVVE